MLFNYVYTLPNATSGGDAIAIQTVSALPSLTPLLLAFVFFTVWLGGISRQKIRTGEADYPLWAVVASLACLMVSLVLSTISGLIQLDWLVIVIVITIFSGVWLFLDRKDGGV